MSEKHDANPKGRITETRIAEYLRTALEFLAERGGSARKSEVIEAVRGRINPTPYERELNASNAERWHSFLVFQSIFFKTAGYLDRGDGIWHLTDSGRQALATMAPLEMFERAREKYAEWKRTRDPATAKGGGTPEGATRTRRTWLIGTGPEGELWDRCRTAGEIRIGFTFGDQQVGDLGAMTSDEIYARIRTLSGEPNPKNNRLACWEFAHEMREGDLVIARAGFRRVLGVGRITGPYRFDADAADYPHSRPVRWFWTKERRLPERVFLSSKTLTDMTRFGDLVDVMLGRRSQEAVDCLGNYQYGADEIDRYFEADPVDIDDDDSALEIVVDDAPPASLFSEVFRGKFPGRDELNDMVRELERKKALILQGPPGTGKTFIATQLAEHFAGDPRRVTRLQFHPAYSYEDFIRGIRPSRDHFEAVDGPLVEAARRAMHDPKRHVLLIDEFNRGNVARILGESLSLIEADKRDRRHAVRLSLAGEPLPGGEPHELWLPPNLYILATMNTADRSIALVDHALRRRFSFIDLKPAFDDRAFEEDLVDRFDGDAGEMDAREVADVKAVAADIVKAMREINGRIAAERSLGAGHCLGHSFFCGDPANRDIRDWARRIFEREIKPHLRECCADQPRLLDDLLRLVPSLDR